MKCWGTLWLVIILKVMKNQGFTLSLEVPFWENHSWGQIEVSYLRVRTFFPNEIDVDFIFPFLWYPKEIWEQPFMFVFTTLLASSTGPLRISTCWQPGQFKFQTISSLGDFFLDNLYHLCSYVYWPSYVYKPFRSYILAKLWRFCLQG